MTPRRRSVVVAVAALAAALAVVLVVALVWVMRPEDAPAPLEAAEPAPPVPTASPVVPPTPAPSGPCARPPRRPFAPRAISVEGVVRRAEVLPVPRDEAGIVGVPPVSDKTAFAWDRGGVRAAARRGHVLLNTHTWPDGSAMGNALLRELHRGDQILLRGEAGQALCYRVTRRDEVLEADGYPGWDATDGPPQLVIVVCSGERLGPGRWTHRTLWFARPVV